MTAPDITQSTVRRILDYDLDTGIFTWRWRDDVPKRWNSRYAGKRAGYALHLPNCKISYWSIRIFDWPFCAHRLAFLHVLGRWPRGVVDHIDRDGLNNRWSNLREATRAQNAANAGAKKNSKTGVRGVCIHKPTGRYRATINIAGKQKHLGHFDSICDAQAAYESALVEYHGEFAMTGMQADGD